MDNRASRQQALTASVEQAIAECAASASAYDFDKARALLAPLRETVDASPDADVKTHDGLIAKISAAQAELDTREADYRAKVRNGWKLIEGKLQSPEDQAASRARAEAERQREERRAAEARRLAQAEADRRQAEAEKRDAEEAAAKRAALEAAERRQAEQEAKRERAAEDARRAALESERVRRANARGSISGSALVVRNNGESTLLRGLAVQLLPVNIPAAVTKSHLDQLVAQKFLIDAERVHVATLRRLITQCTGPTTDAAAVVVMLQRATEWDAADTPAKKLTLRLVGEGDWNAAELIAAKSAVRTSVTGADATFAFNDIPCGNYVVFASFTSSVVHIAWVLPVTCGQDGETKLDLYNDNAAAIVNF